MRTKLVYKRRALESFQVRPARSSDPITGTLWLKNLVAPLAQAELEFLSHFFWWRRKAVVRVLLLRLVVLVVVAIQHRQCIRLSDE